MSKLNMYTVAIPFFPGFYDSELSGMLDHEEEQHIEHATDTGEYADSDYEKKWPQALRVDYQEYANELSAYSDYSTGYLTMAKEYADCVNYKLAEMLDIENNVTRKVYSYADKSYKKVTAKEHTLRATFESMDSPKYYNFSTDRLYMNIPASVMRHMFKLSKADNHATLARVIKERFTSRDGFMSHYENDISDWLEKPLQHWDHNELGTLLVAVIEIVSEYDESDFARDVMETMYESSELAYQAFSESVNWEKLDSALLDVRSTKLVEWLEEDSDAAMIWRAHNREQFDSLVAANPSDFTGFEDTGALPYRCAETLDMFAAM